MKLFRIKLEYESFIVADDEEGAMNIWYSDRQKGLDEFVENIKTTEEIKEVGDFKLQ